MFYTLIYNESKFKNLLRAFTIFSYFWRDLNFESQKDSISMFYTLIYNEGCKVEISKNFINFYLLREFTIFNYFLQDLNFESGNSNPMTKKRLSIQRISCFLVITNISLEWPIKFDKIVISVYIFC